MGSTRKMNASSVVGTWEGPNWLGLQTRPASDAFELRPEKLGSVWALAEL